MLSKFIHWWMLMFVLGFVFDCCLLQQTVGQNCISLASRFVLELTLKRKPTKESSSLGQHLNLSLLSEWILWGNCSSLKMPVLPHVFVFGQPAFLMLEVEDVCFIVKYIGLSQWIDQFLFFLATLKLNWIKLGTSLIKSGICCYHREEKNVFYFTFFYLSF